MFEVQVRVAEMHDGQIVKRWATMTDSAGKPYRFAREADAEVARRLCYGTAFDAQYRVEVVP